MIRSWGILVCGCCVLFVAACASSTPAAQGSSSKAAQSAAFSAGALTGTTGFTAAAGHGTPPTRAAILRSLAGVAQAGARLGRPAAPVKVSLYGDLECPICENLVLGKAFSELVARDVRAGTVQIRYCAFRTATGSRSVFVTQQVAALAAGLQHRFWEFAMLFLGQQGADGTSYVTEGFLDGLALEVPGLNFGRWKQDRAAPALAAQVHSDERYGNRHGVVGTPTLVFRGPRGTHHEA